MPEILITEGVRIYGEAKEAGETVSLSDADARSLLASGRGVLAEPAPEPSEPEPEPKPAPAPPAGRKTQAKPPAPKED